MTVRRLLTMFAVLALMLAACGGNDDSADDEAVGTTEAAQSDGDETEDDPQAEPDPETPEVEAAEDEAAEPVNDIPSDVDLGECGFLVDFFGVWAEDESMMSSEDLFSGESYAKWADALEQTAADAPAEIRSHFETMADAFGQVAESFDDLVIDFSDPEAYNDPEAVQALEEMSGIFEDPRFAEASDAIDGWMEANCPDLVS